MPSQNKNFANEILPSAHVCGLCEKARQWGFNGLPVTDADCIVGLTRIYRNIEGNPGEMCEWIRTVEYTYFDQ